MTVKHTHKCYYVKVVENYIIMMMSCSLLCGIKCTAAMAQVHLFNFYVCLLFNGTMCDGLIQLEDTCSADQKYEPNIKLHVSTHSAEIDIILSLSRMTFALLWKSMIIQ